jgi:hypothetical protein
MFLCFHVDLSFKERFWTRITIAYSSLLPRGFQGWSWCSGLLGHNIKAGRGGRTGGMAQAEECCFASANLE